jgi:hypothetical protein
MTAQLEAYLIVAGILLVARAIETWIDCRHN